MNAAYPEDPDSDSAQAAAEGTAAHWAMAEQMAGRLVMEGDQAPNGVLMTDEMIEAADLIVEDVRQTLAPYGMTLADCVTESPVDIKRVHADCWGTPDIRAWLPGKRLVVWDLKFGHRYVSEFENLQLLGYAFGALDTAGISDLEASFDLRIVQPRAYGQGGPIRSWVLTQAANGRALINVVSNAVHQALGDATPTTRTGPACRDCRGRLGCEAFLRAGQDAMEYAGTAVPHDMPAEAMGVELRYARRAYDTLKARVEALEEQATSMIRRGQRIPHWGVTNGDGRTEWSKPPKEVLAMGTLLGLQLTKPAAAITPKAAQKLGFPASLMEKFTIQKPGAAKLTLDDGSAARKIFTKY